MPHIDDNHNSKILYHVGQKNILFFENAKPCDLDYAFYSCCVLNINDFDFIKKLVNLGVSSHGLEYGCTQAILNKQYVLFNQVLDEFGQSHDIQIFRIPSFDFSTYMVLWAQSDKYLSLFKKVISLMPNHTRRVHGVDKFYNHCHTQIFSDIYNQILKMLLYTPNQILPDAWKSLMQQKFPVSDENIDTIKKKELTHYFTDRLNIKKRNRTLYALPSGLASHVLLVNSNSSKGELDIFVQKILLYIEIIHYLKMPQSLIDSFSKKNKQSRMWLNDEDYAFLHTLENRPHFLNYFRKFYEYDKIKLNQKLDEKLLTHDDTYELVVKI